MNARPLRESIACALAAVALGGCVTLRCPESGGRSWLELRTEHFVLKTDLPRDEALETVRALERLRATEARVLGMAADAPGSLETIVFRDPMTLVDLGTDVGGFVWLSGSEQHAVTISFPLRWSLPRPFFVLAHELAHHLLVLRLGAPPPRWITEGVAVYLETLELDHRRGQAVVGKPPELVRVLHWEQPALPVEALWRWDDDPHPLDTEQVAPRYASSWAWIYVLWDGERERFERFLARAAAGEEPRAAFEAEFTPEVLAKAAPRVANISREVYLRPQLQSVAAPKVEPAVRERSLSTAEVHETFAVVLRNLPSQASGRRHVAQMRVENAKALVHDPHSLEARLSETEYAKTRPERLQRAKEVAALHPQQARAWLAVARHARGSERAEALERAESLAHGQPDLLNDLAWYHVEDGRGATALPLAEEAAKLCPWAANVLDTYAAALALSERCEDAVVQQQRAMRLCESERQRTDFLRRLEIYKKGCKEPPAQPKP
ncbi:MAG: hypothetical protein QM765_34755 [Myxococcales bacterium]